MTSSTPTEPKARPHRAIARNLLRAGVATAALASIATPAARAQQPQVPPPPPPPATQAPGTTPPSEPVDTREFSITPTVALETAVTDNVLLTEHDRKSDLLVRGLVRLDAQLNRGRATGHLSVEGSYDQYARTNDFNGGSLSADGSATYVLSPGFLSVEANGVVTNGRTSSFGAPAIDRAGVNGRVQLAIWDIGPRLTTRLGNFADVSAVARFSQVYYMAADSSRVDTPLPPDDNIAQVSARIDTGERMRAYQLITTGLFQRDDHGYRTANAVQSVYFNVQPAVRLIARGGYERVEQQGVSRIESPVASAGVELTPNAKSRISIEGGTRFNRGAWSARAEVNLSERFFLNGAYTEGVQPDQVFAAESFRSFLEQSVNLPRPIAPPGFQLQDNIYSEASYNRVADLRALFRQARNTLSLTARYSDREFLRSQGHDRTALATLTVDRALRPDLSGTVDLSLARTFASPLYGPSRSYAIAARLEYLANSTTSVTASYALANGKQLSGAKQTIYDNTVLIALRKRF
jgi:uncharacterized protein (PEP-CTERM system associated)